MKNIFVISVFSCVFALSAMAQNLDPTVEVSREYEGKLVEVHKPVMDMAVPDSVTRFALDFDYSVFDNPYKGSYEFSPYLLSMKPSASDSGESRFYLRAGAGYQLHPTLDMVWSPKFQNKGFNLDVYALHRSFFGRYWTIAPQEKAPGVVAMTRLSKSADISRHWAGYDMLTKAGAVFRHDWEKLSLDYSAGYYGLAQKDSEWARGYNALDASLGLKTKPENLHSLIVDAKVDFRHGQDAVSDSLMCENIGGLHLTIGPFLVGNSRMSLDVDADVASYTGALEQMGGDVALVPRYVYRNSRFTADLGVRFAKMLTGEKIPEQYVYPDMNVSYALIPNSMKFYLSATGGGKFETYSSLIASNHHVVRHMLPDLMGYEVERVALTTGFDGRITDVFSYNLRGGYANYASLRHYVMDVTAVPSFSIGYYGCQKWFAALDWAFDVEGFRFDGTVSYDRFWNDSGLYQESGIGNTVVLRPAGLTGNVAFEYNWKQRLVFGADCDFSGAMRGEYGVAEVGTDLVRMYIVEIPGYADLGVYAEYVTARNLSLWMRAGNLLNQTVQRTPLYAEKGVNFTLGICMNL